MFVKTTAKKYRKADDRMEAALNTFGSKQFAKASRKGVMSTGPNSLIESAQADLENTRRAAKAPLTMTIMRGKDPLSGWMADEHTGRQVWINNGVLRYADPAIIQEAINDKMDMKEGVLPYVQSAWAGRTAAMEAWGMTSAEYDILFGPIMSLEEWKKDTSAAFDLREGTLSVGNLNSVISGMTADDKKKMFKDGFHGGKLIGRMLTLDLREEALDCMGDRDDIEVASKRLQIMASKWRHLAFLTPMQGRDISKHRVRNMDVLDSHPNDVEAASVAATAAGATLHGGGPRRVKIEDAVEESGRRDT